MIASAALVLFYVLVPFLILHLCHQYTLISKLGSVLVAYIIGLMIGSLGILPENSREIQDVITMITIPLALPLLLFSSNIQTWMRLAGKTVISMILAISSVVIVVVAGYMLFKNESMPDLWKTGGLLIGVYTGGTPNLAALKIMLGVDNDTYILVHVYDMAISAAYFFFLISFGRGVFGLILPKFKKTNVAINHVDLDRECHEPFWGLLKRENRLPLITGLGLSVFIFAIAGLMTLVVPENAQMIVVVLIITSLGIAFSFIPSVNKLSKSFELGMYLILVFSVTVASMVDFTELANTDLTLLYYVSFAVFGSLILHVLLASLFKIDRDTVMVTSTALICSPPFVPAVAGAIKNKEVVVSGLTVGIVGYAVGNYLGVLVAELLKIL